VKRWLRWLPALQLLLSAGCVTAAYNQVNVNEPIATELLHTLQPGKDDLASCLLALGAPVDVREYQVAADRSSGMALIWYWTDQVGWGAKASTVIRGFSASFEFDWTGTDLPGCVLWFNGDLKLERYSEGLVGELLPTRRRPSPAAEGE
jgi:hypothetical protein